MSREESYFSVTSQLYELVTSTIKLGHKCLVFSYWQRLNMLMKTTQADLSLESAKLSIFHF